MSTSSNPTHFSAFGLTVSGPARYLARHCDTAVHYTSPVLNIAVSRASPDLNSQDWRVSVAMAESKRQAWQTFTRRLDLDAEGSSIYEVIGGIAVECRPRKHLLKVYVPETMNDDAIGAFITGSAMVLYFKTLGRLCLHGAALVKGDRCVVVCGPSGAGKSSLANVLQTEGWRVLTEDLSVVESVEGGFAIRPGYGRIRLWSESVAGLDLDALVEPIVPGAQKYYVRTGPSVTSPVELAQIVFLGERMEGGGELYALDPNLPSGKAVAMLYLNSLIPYTNRPDEIKTLFSACRQIVDRVACSSLRLRDGLSDIKRVAAALGNELGF